MLYYGYFPVSRRKVPKTAILPERMKIANFFGAFFNILPTNAVGAIEKSTLSAN